MKGYTTRTRLLVSLSVSVLLMLGCGRDSTSPDLAFGAKRVYTHTGSNGTLFTLDAENGTLRTSTGHSVVLSARRFRRLASLFDRMNTTDSAITKILGASRTRSPQHNSPRVGPVAAGNRIASVVASSSTSLMAPTKQSAYIGIFDGSDLTGVTCLDIAQNIYVATAVYHQVQGELNAALTDLALAGDDPEELMRDGAMVDALYADLAVQLTALNMLAALYSTYSCWDNNWQGQDPDYPYIDRFVPDSGMGNEGVGTCSTKWGTVEESDLKPGN
jgi:hypothetical protein